MSDFKQKENKAELLLAVDKLLNEYQKLLTGYIQDENNYKRGALLYYWLRDYKNYIKNESRFDSSFLPQFKRGNVVNVNFGFNLGSELGGLHYAIVLSDSSYKNPNLVVVPMTSYKSGHKLNPKCEIFIDDHLFLQLRSKQKGIQEIIRSQIDRLKQEAQPNEKLIDECWDKLDELVKVMQKIKKLKAGSIVNVSQIRVISKMRVIDPQKQADVFYNISVSTKELSEIDKKIMDLFTNQFK